MSDIEFLVVSKKQGTFCETEKALLNFLKVDSKINITEQTKTLNFHLGDSKRIETEYSIKIFNPENSEDRFYNILFAIRNYNIEDYDNYLSFVSYIKSILKRLNNENGVHVYLLKNDFSQYYSVLLYPVLHEFENLLRSFITKVFLINIGSDWADIEINENLKSKVSKRTNNNEVIEKMDDENKIIYEDNILYQLDFRDLSSIMFEEKRRLKEVDLDRIIREARSVTDINIDEIKKYLKTSPWKLYFQDKILSNSVKKEDISKLLDKLFSIRNNIAHNRSISKKQYQEANGICKKLSEIIKKGIEKIEELKLSEEDKEFFKDTKSIRFYSKSELYAYNYYLNKYRDSVVIANEKKIGGPAFSVLDIFIELKDNSIICAEVMNFNVYFDIRFKKIIKLIRNCFIEFSDRKTEFHLFATSKPESSVLELLKREILEEIKGSDLTGKEIKILIPSGIDKDKYIIKEEINLL
ncbi:MAG: hypothetical protein IPG24_27555 [Leptospiraceae bacterium]|nr:hypothetical protein [Leptospiraceae bacterium]